MCAPRRDWLQVLCISDFDEPGGAMVSRACLRRLVVLVASYLVSLLDLAAVSVFGEDTFPLVGHYG